VNPSSQTVRVSALVGKARDLTSSPASSSDELLLQRHLVYEIKMLQESYHRCWRAVTDDADNNEKIINNALIEAFCVHARNLIGFFKDEKFMSCCTTNYRAFTSMPKGKIKCIEDRLNMQISHLVYKGKNKRSILDMDKVNGKDRYEILEILRSEIIEFKEKLSKRYAYLSDSIPVPPHPFNTPVSSGPNATTTTELVITAGSILMGHS
jgi:hypothetical protein